MVNLCSQALSETYAEDAFYYQPLTKYGTNIEYFCPPGMRFVYDHDNDTATTDLVTASETIECQWNQTWTPKNWLPQCKCKRMSTLSLKKTGDFPLVLFLGTSCINPPQPPTINNLTVDYNYLTTPEIPFNGTVRYRCIDKFKFHEDYYMHSFELKCNDDGSWETPNVDEWKYCVDPLSTQKKLLGNQDFLFLATVVFFSVRYCPNPPLPLFGQSYNWSLAESNLKTVYNTKVEYTCQIAMQLQKNDYEETKYDVQTFLCQWNQTWNYDFVSFRSF